MPAYTLNVPAKNALVEAVMSTLKASGLSAAVLAPLTTTAGLIAAYEAVDRHGSFRNHFPIGGVRDLNMAVTELILTNSIVAAGNTMALLLAGIDDFHSAPTTIPDVLTANHFWA